MTDYDDDMPSGHDDEMEDDRPASEKEDDAFMRQVREWFKADQEHTAEWRKEAKEDYDFVAGSQWSEEDQAKLKDELRPVITFNRIAPTIEAVTGLEIGNRREVQFIPREQGDIQKNEILTSAAEWFRDECDAEDEESDAFFDTIVCGMGWTETRLDYEEDPDGTALVDRLDPLEMYWDKSARKRNLVDAKRKWRVRTLPIEDAKALVPDAEEHELDAAWARGEEKDQPHDADQEDAYQDEPSRMDRAKKEVTIVHLQWWEREPYWRVAFNGEMAEVDEKDYRKLKSRADKLAKAFPDQIRPLQAVKQMRRKYMQAFIGSKVLDRGPVPADGHFSWECITGKRDHNKGTWYGLVRSMKDPQRWANKWLSQTLHILNSDAKGGLFAERGAFEDDRQAEASYARNDQITWLKNGALGERPKIQKKDPTNFPAGFDRLMEFAVSSIRDVSGVNLELLGLRGAEQAGVLEEQRKQAGMTILASLFDSLRRYRKRQGRILLHFIMNDLSDGRLVRIVGQEAEQYVPLIREEGSVKYDVIVDDSPTAPNQKEKVWSSLVQLLPVLGNILGPEEWVTLAEYSPLPSSVIDKLKAGFEEKKQAEKPMQEMQQQMMQEGHQAEMAKRQSEVAENEADAQKRMAEAAHQQMETQLLPTMVPNDFSGYINI